MPLGDLLPCAACGKPATLQYDGNYYCTFCGELSTPDFTEAKPENDFAWLRDAKSFIPTAVDLDDLPLGAFVRVATGEAGTYALNWDWIRLTNNRWMRFWNTHFSPRAISGLA